MSSSSMASNGETLGAAEGIGATVTGEVDGTATTPAPR